MDLVALQEPRLRRGDALDRDRGHLLADSEHLRRPCGDVLEQAVQRGEPLVAGADVVAAVLLEVTEERDHPLEGQIVERQARDLAALLGGDEHEQEPDRVAVAAHRARAEALDGDQVIDEEARAGSRRAAGVGHRAASESRRARRRPRIDGWPPASSCGVIVR